MVKTTVRARVQRGFTLIEMIMVIIVLSAVSIGVSSFVHFGIDIYRDAVGRDQQIGDSRFLIERLTRELREALPNSVRVSDEAGKPNCLEFVPIVASSSYIDIAVLPEALSDSVRVVLPAAAVPLTAGDKIVIYPLEPDEIYVSPTSVSGKVFSLGAGVPARVLSGAVVADVSLSKSVQFAADSPTERYYIVKDAVSYCAEGSNIKRYSGYWRAGSQQSPALAIASGVLMAENQVNNKPFVYHHDSLTRSAMVQLNFEFSYDDERLKLYHEVHVVNVP